MLDKKLSTQNDALGKIFRELRDFGTEHRGIWIYGSGDDDERDYRRRVAEAEAAQRREFEEKLGIRERSTTRPPRPTKPAKLKKPKKPKRPKNPTISQVAASSARAPATSRGPPGDQLTEPVNVNGRDVQ